MQTVYDTLLFVGRFVWQPFTDAWKVARNDQEVLPAREFIGWLSAMSMVIYFAIAAAAYYEKWRVLTACIVVYVAVYLVRTFIWTILDLLVDDEGRIR
ncbi:MAG: hypothetical protein Q7S75_01760 [bacterium]|nr:hypothetical protein [bacterium]